jgi:HSP20 family protein
MAFFPRFVDHDFAPALRGENSLFRLMDDYASLVNRSFASNPSFAQTVRTFQPRFDMKENKDSYELHGELPGIAQKDINIEFTDATTLSIRGRTETVREEGRRPTALIESQSGQQQKKLADAETESTSSSNKSFKATVEDENEDSTTVASATPVEIPAASEAPASQEVSENQQADKSSYWISERSVGSFARSFSFPQRVDQDAVKASLKDGILSIIVPKAQAPAKRRIQIE